ncbi:MAG TPA: hypothetical protein VFQ00_13525 [Terriglobales bacterium]|nr:hypothetical protein [Terriglobales bacterium]
MKHAIAFSIVSLILLGQSFAKDKSNDYQMGTFVKATAVRDGTITSTIRGDGTTVAGDVYRNHVGIYLIRVANRTWYLETERQAGDSMLRNLGQTPTHFKSEKPNPLDSLKNGDKVLFRLERHRKLNGTETDVYIPFADNPKKEAKFVASFVPDLSSAEQPSKRPTTM